VVVASYTVTISGSAGSTVTGPSLTIDDFCSYEGVYGTLTYTGSRGMVQYCRALHFQTYSDSSFSSALPYTTQYASNNYSYSIVTNDGSPGTTELTPLYIQVWFDANGDGVFDTGDPYTQVGPVTPSTDGLLQNINFGDTYIK
jgi:hypothetical protein